MFIRYHWLRKADWLPRPTAKVNNFGWNLLNFLPAKMTFKERYWTLIIQIEYRILSILFVDSWFKPLTRQDIIVFWLWRQLFKAKRLQVKSSYLRQVVAPQSTGKGKGSKPCIVSFFLIYTLPWFCNLRAAYLNCGPFLKQMNILWLLEAERVPLMDNRSV